jgi:hypothetical protein
VKTRRERELKKEESGGRKKKVCLCLRAVG